MIRRPEHERARAWREARGLSARELAALVGYSPEAVWRFERGETTRGKAHSPGAWTRYRLACAAMAKKAEGFDWS